ncbi:MAG: hypothetical protein ACK5LJ_00900 [Paracoccus sp. (in: a-proteobacteria)]
MAASRSTVRVYSDESVAPLLCSGRGKNITDPLHMPESHRAYLQSTPDDLCCWAAETGKEVERLFLAMQKNKHIKPFALPKQMVRHRNVPGNAAFNALSPHAAMPVTCGTQTIESVSNILFHGINLRSKSPADRVVSQPVQHENVRGAASYDGSQE